MWFGIFDTMGNLTPQIENKIEEIVNKHCRFGIPTSLVCDGLKDLDFDEMWRYAIRVVYTFKGEFSLKTAMQIKHKKIKGEIISLTLLAMQKEAGNPQHYDISDHTALLVQRFAQRVFNELMEKQGEK